MTEIEIGREKLRAALLEVCEDYLESVELAPEEDVWYSPKLEKKMAKFLKHRSSTWYECFDTTFKKVCAACLLLTILFGALMSCKPIRDPVIKFFQNIYEQFTEFWIEDENASNSGYFIEEAYTLTYIPDGYELIEKQDIASKERILTNVFEDNEGNKIYFYQALSTMKFAIDSCSKNPEIYYDGEIQIFLIQVENEFHTFWNTEKYAYSLVTQGISKEEVIKIVKSLDIQ